MFALTAYVAPASPAFVDPFHHPVALKPVFAVIVGNVTLQLLGVVAFAVADDTILQLSLVLPIELTSEPFVYDTLN